jgi:hypothetical protein
MFNIAHLVKTPMLVVSDMAGEGYLDILGAPFGGPLDGRDFTGAYFDESTDFLEDMIPWPGLFYWHGKLTKSSTDRYGEIIHRWKDQLGVWFRVKLDLATEIGDRLWQAAKDGKAFASTGVVPASFDMDKATGLIKSWLIGDLTLIDEDIDQGRIPVNYYAIARPALAALAKTSVPEDKREFFESVFLTEGEVTRPEVELDDSGTEVNEGEEPKKGDSTMKRDLLRVKAHLSALSTLVSSLAADAEGDAGDVESLLDGCEECRGLSLDEQTKTLIAQMNKTILDLKTRLAASEHAAWINAQVAAGRVQPAEKEQLVKTLGAAFGTGVEDMVKTIMQMVESRNVTPVAPTPDASTLRVAGFQSGKPEELIDESYYAQIKQFVGMTGGK